MKKLSNLEPNRVFYYFEEISAIPRGSGNRKGIADYIENFAKEHALDYVHDDAHNVIVFKSASNGYEDKEPVILQGHLDMVCQKDASCDIDFEKDGISLCVENGYIKADGTTLGADNGSAVAMMLAILESDSYNHPPIEAVFTSDEEVGMLGAKELSADCLKGRRMINLDSEKPEFLTVSCAGGSDFCFKIDTNRRLSTGRELTITLKGCRGGHSGIEIDKGRVNADVLLGRILDKAQSFGGFDIISVYGGDKGNAIPTTATAHLLVRTTCFKEKLDEYIKEIKSEISARESEFEVHIQEKTENSFQVLGDEAKETLIFLLMAAPNGVMSMSAEIENLVETSLNLGVLKTEEDEITLHFALRSNKKSALAHLEDKLTVLAKKANCRYETLGHYPPWEYKDNSFMQKLYLDIFNEKFGFDAKVIAIHAGLECGMFSDKIKDLDCISFGPETLDVHTTSEKLSIDSTKNTFELVLLLLEKM